MKYSRWTIPYDSLTAARTLESAGFTPLLSALLVLRGITVPAQAKEFLSGRNDLPDPMLMKGMDRAAARLRRAFEAKEKIAVYGDYDVDGITSTCLLTEWLRSKGVDCKAYIPDRMAEGYGLNNDAIDKLKAEGVSLIITVDCGITANAEAEHAKQVGVDLVITDHHECKEQMLPDACAVVDPKQDGCPYPNKNLAGVGVALKLVCAVEGESEAVVERFADLAAIGTVADVVPLTGENRYIVRRGIDIIEHSERPGIISLLREAGVTDKKLSSSTIGFALAPRLNAAGRLGSVAVAAKLLLTKSHSEAAQFAEQLCELNRQRQTLENGIWEEASAKVAGRIIDEPIVLSDDNWHQGVIGIAASKLSEQYSVPTIMICLDGEKGKGSCRSYGGFNLFDALSACSEHLDGFGGHALAAGLNIHREKLESFKKAFSEYYRKNKPAELPALNCDLEVTDPELLNMENVRSLEGLEPFGSGNPKPVLCLCNAKVERMMPIGNGRHIRINVSYKGQTFACVFFSHTEEETGVHAGDAVDIAFTPQINEFRLRSSVQLQLVEIRKHDPEALCMRLMDNTKAVPIESAAMYCPDRPAFVTAWRCLKNHGGMVADDIKSLLEQCPAELEPEKFCLCILAWQELGLIAAEREGTAFGARICDTVAKVNLEDSALINKLKERRH